MSLGVESNFHSFNFLSANWYQKPTSNELRKGTIIAHSANPQSLLLTVVVTIILSHINKANTSHHLKNGDVSIQSSCHPMRLTQNQSLPIQFSKESLTQHTNLPTNSYKNIQRIKNEIKTRSIFAGIIFDRQTMLSLK